MRLSFSLILPPALAFVLGAAVVAQEAAAPAPKADEKPAETAPAADTAGPAADVPYSYSVDFGYRAIPSRGGDFQTYRSVLNLGEGPKLFGGTFSYETPHRLFDRIEIQANDWGGEPYTTGRLYIRKLKLYEFSVNYRDIAYFNAEPSFADPTVLGGVLLNQRSFDTRYRMADVDLTLRPGSRIIPYLAWSHGSRYGNGITTYETDLNEYPVGTLYRDKTDYLRGGVRLEMNRFHVTLEEGGLVMKDDQQVYSNGFSSGNRTTPFFGQQLTLTNALEAYGVRGDGLFSKVLMTGSVTSWLDVYGQFEYSQPSTTVHYFQNAAGNFLNLDSLLFFTREQALLNSQSKEPHTSGSIGFELRPLSRLRIIENVSTDRLHVASSGLLNDTLLPATGDNLFTTTPQGDRYVLNYSQQEVNAIFDVTKKLTIRGGHRYVWGNLETRAPILSEATTESAELKRNVGLAGVTYRPIQKLTLNVDLEAASGDRNYFRTSLQDYTRAVARARYQLLESLSLGGNYFILDNRNPTPTVDYSFRSQAGSLSVLWAPSGGKKFSILGEYTRSLLRSDLSYIVPQTRVNEQSLYRDDAHSGTGALDLPLWFAPGAKVSLGGSYFFSSGSRPTHYNQPFAKLQLPPVKHVQLWGEWRWYGYAEPFYGYENFRANLILVGLRISR